jgi:hypothetical protein
VTLYSSYSAVLGSAIPTIRCCQLTYALLAKRRYELGRRTRSSQIAIMLTLQDLPLEIIFNIIDYVDTRDLVSIVRLNRWWATQIYDTSRNRIVDMVEKGWILRVSRLGYETSPFLCTLKH